MVMNGGKSSPDDTKRGGVLIMSTGSTINHVLVACVYGQAGQVYQYSQSILHDKSKVGVTGRLDLTLLLGLG